MDRAFFLLVVRVWCLRDVAQCFDLVFHGVMVVTIVSALLTWSSLFSG